MAISDLKAIFEPGTAETIGSFPSGDQVCLFYWNIWVCDNQKQMFINRQDIGRFPRHKAWGGQRGKTFNLLACTWICPAPYISFQQCCLIFKFLSNSYADAVPAGLAKQVLWKSFWLLFQDIFHFLAFSMTWDPELDLNSDGWGWAELRNLSYKPIAAFSLELSFFRAFMCSDPMFGAEGCLWMCYSLYSSFVSPNSLKLTDWRWVMLH